MYCGGVDSVVREILKTIKQFVCACDRCPPNVCKTYCLIIVYEWKAEWREAKPP